MLPLISVIGGTGAEGSGLALRWAFAGYSVCIGSRTLEKAMSKVDELKSDFPDVADFLTGQDNYSACQTCDIAVLAVPYSAHANTLLEMKENLRGKILVDVTVPLNPPNVDRVYLPEGGSAGLEAQVVLGSEVKVVSAFQNIAAGHLQDPNADIDCDVLVCGNDSDACDKVVELVKAAGMNGYNAGLLDNSVAVEALTPVLISLNKQYRVRNAGIKIVGIGNT
ncbi:MAG TPA: NADPH-dependent F420 reductase [Chloroflexi bacterium]|nr:NADPH-dependent F420 reductase [Chloroflexota bacterium]HCU98220.1 NADPH-dependent F420 reductase [Chloroflexota bacterium]|tara:strand:+ start:6344 stop:7012 length:669 start_codon:yes stop_codon:yes gene_type:complete